MKPFTHSAPLHHCSDKRDVKVTHMVELRCYTHDGSLEVICDESLHLSLHTEEQRLYTYMRPVEATRLHSPTVG